MSEPWAEYDRIWLEPACERPDCRGAERTWCSDNVWAPIGCEECGKQATEFRRTPSVTREQIAGALCKADGTSQCAAICLSRFASHNRDGRCSDAIRVWGHKADAILALLWGG